MKIHRLLICAAMAFGLTLSAVAQTATPQPQPVPQAAAIPTIIPPAPQLNARSFILINAANGNIIAEKNAHDRYPMASLTKLTSLYVVFNALANGQIHLDDKVLISKKAWSMGGSRMFVRAGHRVSVRDLIRGVIVASGNDAVTALAQYVGGNISTFVSMMNQTAQRLGMKNTHYEDPTGLPKPQHYSTAYDLSIITRAIIQDFPQYYHFFDEKWIDWDHIKQPNRNRLLWRDTWVDGLKTGHTDAAGYCLITSGKQNGMRLISVIMGTPTDAARNDDSQALLDYGFRFYDSHTLYSKGETIAKPRVWLGEDKYLDAGLDNDLTVTIPKGEYDQLKVSMALNKPIKAPIAAGQSVGKIQVTLHGKVIAEAALVSLDADPVGGLISRGIDHIEMLFH